MSVQVAASGGTARPGGVAAAAAAVPWPYAEYMARWERRQLFLRSYHFSRDDAAADAPVGSRSSSSSPRGGARARARARRVVWAGLRRLRRAAATGLRRLRARLRLCFGWATLLRARRPQRGRAAATAGFRYGRLSGGKATRTTAAPAVYFW